MPITDIRDNSFSNVNKLNERKGGLEIVDYERFFNNKMKNKRYNTV